MTPTSRGGAQKSLKLGRAHAVLVCHVAGDKLADLPREQLAHARRTISLVLSELRPIGAAPLVDEYEGGVCAVVVTAPSTPLATIGDAAASLLSAARLPAGARPVAGLSGVLPGVAGIAQAYRQAQRTADLARRLGWSGPVSTYREMLPYHLLAADPALARDVHDELVAGLAVGGRTNGRADELVETLRVYLAARRGPSRIKQAATELCVHRHTVSARLLRIEKLAGVDLADPSCVLLLQLALRARDVLGSTQAKGPS